MKRLNQVPVIIFLVLSLLNIGRGETRPRLVVFVVVDMMREDTFDRFHDIFKGGLKYLYENGIYYDEAHHAHAYTATSPGHFVLSSGRYPGPAGVLGNSWYDPELKKNVYSVEDESALPLSGRNKHVSFKYIPATTLGDWIKGTYPNSKVFSIGGKDRGAIMLGGKHPDGVFWFDFDGGNFITTNFYMVHYPNWLIDFNNQRYPDIFRDSTWNRLLPNQAIYLERSREDDFPPEQSSRQSHDTTFPHHFKNGKEGEIDYNFLWNFPWLDHLIIDLAKIIVEKESMGKDTYPDLLYISFSMIDAIGHRYGPFSQETMDSFLRLDRKLGDFFNFLDEKIGLENVLIVFSSDHGVTMMPEYAKRLGYKGGRIKKSVDNLVENLESVIAKTYGEGDYIEIFSGGWIYYNRDLLKQKQIKIDKLNNIVIPIIEKEKWVEKVYTQKEIKTDLNLDYWGRLFRHHFNPKHSGDIAILFKRNFIYKGKYGTTHGTPYAYDTHVPLIFAGDNLKPDQRKSYVETVNVAPTIAKLLSVSFPDSIDGRPLLLK